MSDSDEKLFTARDFCFAHVKSYPWWPARIVGCKERCQKKVRSEIFSVVFFGTKETADLPAKELESVSDASIQKYVNKASMRRKHFNEAYEAMMEEVKSKSSAIPTKQEFLLCLDLQENRVLQELTSSQPNQVEH